MTTPTTGRPLALVTGASSGIGYELARQFAEHGYDLVVAAEDERIEQAASDLRQLGVNARPVRVDLSTYEGVERLWAETTTVGRVDGWTRRRSTRGSASTATSRPRPTCATSCAW
jgi:short-subunit dehydrogenase